MRVLLDLVYIIAAPFALLALFLISRFSTGKRYFAALRKRLAFPFPKNPAGPDSRPGAARPCLWVHAVSVGEARTSLTLLKALAGACPGWDQVLSVSTETGFEAASRILSAELPGVRLIYFPLDFSWMARRALRSVRPRAVILIELELWPNFLIAARKLGVPVFVANGRLTERSSRRYLRAGPFGRWLFSLPAGFAVQNDDYARRFAALGVPPERLRVLGNLKYDGTPAPGPEPAETWRRLRWTPDLAAPLLVAGCTHPGEEAAILEAFEELLAVRPGLRLVLAPRHVERVGEVLDLCMARSAQALPGSPALWTRLADRDAARGETRVVIVDSIGELDRFYAIADLVFIGGSLVPRGGHNILEPARFGKAVLFGPSMFNFEDLARHFLERGAAVQVGGAGKLASAARSLLEDRGALERLGARAAEAASDLRGAARRHAEWLQEILAGMPNSAW